MIKNGLLYLMAAFYFLGGINHFYNPDFYLQMMPPYLPAHELLNQLAGAAEIILAILLVIPSTRAIGAWGVIALLIAIFPANLYMYQMRDSVFASIPPLILLARLPMQLVLMAWAWWYT